MLDALPQDYGFLSSLTATASAEQAAVAECAQACGAHTSGRCRGFTFVGSGSGVWTCALVSTYSDERTDVGGARFFVLPQCSTCGDGFTRDGLGCIELTQP